MIDLLENKVGKDTKTTPLKAIKQKCFECSGNSINEVKICAVEDCFLYPFRLGKNSKIKKQLSEEEKLAKVELMKKARSFKNN